MRTFHDQLRSLSALPRQDITEEPLAFPPLLGRRNGFSPEDERDETPRDRRKGKRSDSAWREVAPLPSAAVRSQSPLRALSPYTVLLFSSIALTQQFGGSVNPGSHLLPSLVGATLRSLPELHASQPGLPASNTSQRIPSPSGESPEESQSDRKQQNRRLSSVLRLLRRAERALVTPSAEASERVVLLMRNALEHISHLGEGHRLALAGPLSRFALLLSHYIEQNGETPELTGVLDSLLTVI